MRTGTRTVEHEGRYAFLRKGKPQESPPFTLTRKLDGCTDPVSLANETRYSSLARKFPDRAKDLFAKSEAAAQARFDYLQKLVELNK